MSNEKTTDITNIVEVLFRGETAFGEYFHSRDETIVDSRMNSVILDDANHPNINLISTINTNDEKFNITTDEKSGIYDDIKDVGKSFLQRMFSKMETGSLRASIFSVCSLTLGAGSLSLPQVISKMSLVTGLIMLILGAISAYWSLTILILASVKMKEYDYTKLIKAVLGRGASTVFDLTILIFILGVIISYEVTSKIEVFKLVYKLLGSFMYDVYYQGSDYIDLDDFIKKVWSQYYMSFPILYGVNAIIVIPICLIKELSKMKNVSLAGLMCLIYVILVIVIQSPFFIIENVKNDIYSKPEINWSNVGSSFTTLWFFKGTAVFFLGYTCHQGVFTIYSTLKNNVIRRTNKVLRRSTILIFIIYILSALCGFLSVPILPPDLIVYRKSIFSTDVFMTIAKLGMTFTLLMAIPVNYNCLRLSLFKLVWNTHEIGNFKNFLITIPVMAVSILVAILYTQVMSYLSILGGFCSVLVCFIFPGNINH